MLEQLVHSWYIKMNSYTLLFHFAPTILLKNLISYNHLTIDVNIVNQLKLNHTSGRTQLGIKVTKKPRSIGVNICMSSSTHLRQYPSPHHHDTTQTRLCYNVCCDTQDTSTWVPNVCTHTYLVGTLWQVTLCSTNWEKTDEASSVDNHSTHTHIDS